jgi:hypothetical protein
MSRSFFVRGPNLFGYCAGHWEDLFQVEMRARLAPDWATMTVEDREGWEMVLRLPKVVTAAGMAVMEVGGVLKKYLVEDLSHDPMPVNCRLTYDTPFGEMGARVALLGWILTTETLTQAAQKPVANWGRVIEEPLRELSTEYLEGRTRVRTTELWIHTGASVVFQPSVTQLRSMWQRDVIYN